MSGLDFVSENLLLTVITFKLSKALFKLTDRPCLKMLIAVIFCSQI